MSLNAALQHAGVNSQKDRVALNKSHEHMQELAYSFNQSQSQRAKLENELHDERQEHRMLQENLTHERIRHEETEQSLACIWNSHRRLGDIISKVKCYNEREEQEDYAGYNLTELVLELEAQHCKVRNLENKAEERQRQEGGLVMELEGRIQTAAAQHEEEMATKAVRISELELQLLREQSKTFAGAQGQQVDNDSTNKRRRRRCRGRGGRVNQEFLHGGSVE